MLKCTVRCPNVQEKEIKCPWVPFQWRKCEAFPYSSWFLFLLWAPNPRTRTFYLCILRIWYPDVVFHAYLADKAVNFVSSFNDCIPLKVP